MMASQILYPVWKQMSDSEGHSRHGGLYEQLALPREWRTTEEELFNNGSHKKPLSDISHKITEKKTPPTPAEGLLNSHVFPKKLSKLQKQDCGRSLVAPDRNPNIYLLIQKMKMILSSFTSIMLQLLDKVKPAFCGVKQTKKLVGPREMKPKSQAPLCPQRPIWQTNSNTL